MRSSCARTSPPLATECNDAMGEWKKIKFSDLYAIPSRNGVSKPSRVRGAGYKMINMGELFSHDWIFDIPMELVPLSDAEKNNSQVAVDDLLFARQSMVASGAGRCVLVREVNELTVFESHLIRVRLNQTKSLPLFYYYYFRSGCSNIASIVQHVVQAGIRASDLSDLEVDLPPLPTQKKIAAVLSALDDKIENNRKICANLEAQAQAIFKSWFVDFEPWGGVIPEGWRMGRLGDVAECNPYRKLVKGDVARCVEMADLTVSGPFPTGWSIRRYNGGMKFSNGDTIIARITPCFENGKVAFVNFLEDREVAFGSTEYVIVSPRGMVPAEWFYCLARDPGFITYAKSRMNGSSGRQRFTASDIAEYEIPIAPVGVYEKVAPLFASVMKKIKNCGFESRALSALRDALLPKLMSGEIDVDKVEV